MSEPRTTPSSAVWTIPNVISMVRIALIVVFVVLFVARNDGWAIAALAGAGVSDFLDGYLARRWNQVTALGRILDPMADRMLTLAVVIAFAWRGVIPWWLFAVVVARDLVVGAALLYGRSRGVESPQVTRVGKWATALLYVFLPLAYLAFERWDAVHVVAIVGAAGAAGLYWGAGIGYVRDVARRASIAGTPGPRTMIDEERGGS